MAYEIVMPRLGWTMEEGVFLEWLKRSGDECTLPSHYRTNSGKSRTIFDPQTLLPEQAPFRRPGRLPVDPLLPGVGGAPGDARSRFARRQ